MLLPRRRDSQCGSTGRRCGAGLDGGDAWCAKDEDVWVVGVRVARRLRQSDFRPASVGLVLHAENRGPHPWEERPSLVLAAARGGRRTGLTSGATATGIGAGVV